MKVLALDIATRTGWALSTGEYGAIELPKGSTHCPVAIASFYGQVCDLIAEHEPVYVFIEHPAQRFAGQNLLSIELAGAAIAASGAHGLGVYMVAPRELKEFATGSGNASKAQMVEAANAKFGLALTSKNEDEADAIHLAHYGPTIMTVEAA